MECKICGFSGKSLISHITRKHNMTIDSYKETYNVTMVHTVSNKQKQQLSSLWKTRMKDAYWKNKMNKNKKSIWTIDYWTSNGYSKEDAIEKIKKYQSENSKKRNYDTSPSTLTKAYWISRGYSEIDAVEKISVIQSNLSKYSNKFSGYTHTNNSKKMISTSMKNHIKLIGNTEWTSHFGDSWVNINRSVGEIQIFDYVQRVIQSVSANEFICGYNVDMVVGNKIIEYFGDFWHGGETMFTENDVHPVTKLPICDMREYDRTKINTLIENGYELLIIWESDYYTNKSKVFDKINKFLDDTSEKS